MKRLLGISFFVVMGLLLVGCGAAGGQAAAPSTPIPTVVAENVIVAEGRLEPVHYVDIAFNASGTVSEVLVSEGEHVTAGQVVARLENSEAKQAEVARAEEAFLQAQQAFDGAEAAALGKLAEANEAVQKAQRELDDFDVPSEIADMTPRDALIYTQGKLDEARANYEPYRHSQPNSRNAKEYKKRLEDAWADYNRAILWTTREANLNNALAKLAQAQKEYDTLSNGSETGDKALAEAQFEAASANLAAARAALADVELTAPFDGTVAGLKVKTGESVSPGQIAASLADFSGWIIKTTDLTELDVVNITEGQAVQIALDALPEEVLDGIVLWIGQNYSEQQGDVVYEVTVALTEALPNMRWGMTTVVKFAD
jgi:multidrug resistance efflux pump